MKAVVTTVAILFTMLATQAATYNYSSSGTWTSKIGSTSCWTCTINITSGQTLTIDYAGTCGSCTINGGNIIVSQNFTCQSCTFNVDNITMAGSLQMNLQSSTTTFNNTTFNLSGTANILSTAGTTFNNSVVNFSGSSYFNNNGGTFLADNTKITLSGSAYMLTSSAFNLKNGTNLTIGDGTLASTAYVNNNSGTKMIIYDNSMIKIANEKNSYRNNSSYTYTPTSGGSTNYNINPNSVSCGSGHASACQSNYVYGCATMNSAGILACTTLALAAPDLAAKSTNAGDIALTWDALEDGTTATYTIERSSNGLDWTLISTIDAVAYNTTYRYTDVNVPTGTGYYRVLMTNKDGKRIYSRVVTVSVGAAGKGISLYPNPTIDHSFSLRTATTGALLVNVYTMSGQLIFTTSLKGQTQYSVTLPAGIASNNYYAVRISGGEGAKAFNLMVR